MSEFSYPENKWKDRLLIGKMKNDKNEEYYGFRINNNDGIFTVKDTGGHCFDFDVLTENECSSINTEKSYKVYVLSWGNGKIADSFISSKKTVDKIHGDPNKFNRAWNGYKTYGGSTMQLLKFNQEDANIKNESWY